MLAYPPVDLSDAFEVTTVFGPSDGLRMSDLQNCYMITKLQVKRTVKNAKDLALFCSCRQNNAQN